MKTSARLTICVGFVVAALNVVAGPEAIESGKDKNVVMPTPESCTWTGFYFGGQIGYGWLNPDANLTPLPQPDFSAAVRTDVDLDANGITGGGQIGYNYQLGHFVIGAETDFSGSDMGDSTTHTGTIGRETQFYHADENIDWYGTARLRLGFAPSCRFLLYGTGGLAYGDANCSGNLSFGSSSEHYPISFDEMKIGWAAGGGGEFSLNRHWSVRAEYLYIDLGDKFGSASGLPENHRPFRVDYHWETAAHTFNFGLNYRF
jgi:outer membrane immunogenic protein